MATINYRKIFYSEMPEWNIDYYMPVYSKLIPRGSKNTPITQSWVYWLMQQGSAHVMENCGVSVQVCTKKTYSPKWFGSGYRASNLRPLSPQADALYPEPNQFRQ